MGQAGIVEVADDGVPPQCIEIAHFPGRARIHIETIEHSHHGIGFLQALQVLPKEGRRVAIPVEQARVAMGQIGFVADFTADNVDSFQQPALTFGEQRPGNAF